ncbi:PIN domain-containing protein [Pseudomonas ogarae]|uniref:PIN domain-containing protein n=1 Tax=Pseudomonas ogarae (strain DSM 112162 / CECT 30235 / F113) TaxID=1114970 RepID=UPI001951511D|nr:PIN domain-containing protein [Pseudomonas ogarae]
MHLVMLDTCVWLDISSQKSELPMLKAIEHLVKDGVIKILLPDLVRTEYERNKERVIEATRKRLANEFRVVKGVIESFGGDGKDMALATLDDVNHRLPILSEATEGTVKRVLKLFDKALVVAISDQAKIKAAERAIAKKAPFHKQKNSVADAVLIETFHEYRLENVERYDSFRFVTHNVNDFSAKDHRLPHEDFAEIFDDKTHFYNATSQAVEDLLDLDEFHYEYDWAWEDQTRGLQEILGAMDELVDKVWYNRHMNRAYQIEQGIITLIPEGTERKSNNDIHQHIWKGALAAAERVKSQYENTGPWDDFEWGMINGKLSALRWILGDEWDMLDT